MPQANTGQSRQLGSQPYGGAAVRARSATSKLDIALALGLLLSPSSQLRPNGFPIGPGELCLAVWLVLMFGRTAMQRGFTPTPALSRLVVFWALFAVALSVGTMTGFALHDRHDPVWFMHDTIAYPFLATVSCLCVVGPDAESRFHHIARLLMVMGTGSLALQLADAGGYISPSQIDPWYWNRFRGWSENPEQLALLCTALALLSLHVLETAVRPIERLAAVACAVLSIYVGRLTQTDTFTIVLLVAAPAFIVLKAKTWLRSPERKLPFRSAVAWIGVFALPLALAAFAPIATLSAGRTMAMADAMLKDNGRAATQEAELRLHLWTQAWERGVESGMLGLGPGPHLNIPPSIVAARAIEQQAPKNISHPAVNGTPNFEAHNTLLDLFTQGGMLAALSFLWLTGAAMITAYRAQFAGLTTMVGGLFLFGMVGSIVRQPIFWFAIAFGLVVSGTASDIRRRVAIATSTNRAPRFNVGVQPISATRIDRWRVGTNSNSGRNTA